MDKSHPNASFNKRNSFSGSAFTLPEAQLHNISKASCLTGCTDSVWLVSLALPSRAFIDVSAISVFDRQLKLRRSLCSHYTVAALPFDVAHSFAIDSRRNVCK
ncbi:hypothetical protein V3481_007218 [Fusarium oxysporum f. sp. vasinfectum]